LELSKQTTVNLGTIPWHIITTGAILGAGGYGVVYEVMPGLVVKVGLIADEEVEAQQRMAGVGKSVPVHAFAHGIYLPENICRNLCGVHGFRTVSGGCSCHERRHDVLMMPKAEPAFSAGYTPAQVKAFLDEILLLSSQILGRSWALDEEAVMDFEGHLIVVDFGIP